MRAVRLTKNQIEAAAWLPANGEWYCFGSGRYVVGMRALHRRAPELVEYITTRDREYFRITPVGLDYVWGGGKASSVSDDRSQADANSAGEVNQ